LIASKIQTNKKGKKGRSFGTPSKITTQHGRKRNGVKHSDPPKKIRKGKGSTNEEAPIFAFVEESSLRTVKRGKKRKRHTPASQLPEANRTRAGRETTGSARAGLAALR